MQLCWLNKIYIVLFVRGKEKQASISYSVLLGLVLCYFLLIHSLHQSSPPFCLTIGSTCFLSSWPEGQPQFLGDILNAIEAKDTLVIIGKKNSVHQRSEERKH